MNLLFFVQLSSVFAALFLFEGDGKADWGMFEDKTNKTRQRRSKARQCEALFV
jgi:hypothetical protein